jgi:hypothetical protein
VHKCGSPALPSGLHRNTITKIKIGRWVGDPRLLELIEAALSKAGVEFIEENGGGAGVRLKKPPKKHLIGQGRYQPDIRHLVESCDLRFFTKRTQFESAVPQSLKKSPGCGPGGDQRRLEADAWILKPGDCFREPCACVSIHPCASPGLKAIDVLNTIRVESDARPNWLEKRNVPTRLRYRAISAWSSRKNVGAGC